MGRLAGQDDPVDGAAVHPRAFLQAQDHFEVIRLVVGLEDFWGDIGVDLDVPGQPGGGPTAQVQNGSLRQNHPPFFDGPILVKRQTEPRRELVQEERRRLRRIEVQIEVVDDLFDWRENSFRGEEKAP